MISYIATNINQCQAIIVSKFFSHMKTEYRLDFVSGSYESRKTCDNI